MIPVIHCGLKRSLLFAGALCTLFPVGSALHAQTPEEPRPPAANVTLNANPNAGPLLDRPVNRAEYILGPGDIVVIGILGNPNRLFTLPVGPEGTVMVPTVGGVQLIGMNLNDAEKRVRAAVLQYYRNVEITLTLAQLRSFKTYVVGDVANPGVHVANSAMRVSELMNVALSARPAADQEQSAGKEQHRNLVLRRSNGDTLIVDLLRFFRTGDLTANPYLREGDAVIVPPTYYTVEVLGAVAFPDQYEFRRGESLAELLELANGGAGFRPEAGDTVRVSRMRGGRAPREVFVMSRGEAGGNRGRQFLLEPFDAVFIPSIGDYHRRHYATILGQVVRPGNYPIEPDRTTVRQLIDMAGGFLPDAAISNATLRRLPSDRTREAARALEATPVEALSDEERRILQARVRGDENNVVIDFSRLVADGASVYNFALQGGDVLTVPRLRNEVAVIGAVRQPGIVQYASGLSIDRYVAAAGGYSTRADRNSVTVLKAKLGTQASRKDAAVIEPGDQIVVPYRAHRTLLERVQIANNSLSIIMSAVVAIVAVRQLF